MAMENSADLSVLAGGPLIGYILNWALYGILTVQVYWYYLAFPKDKWRTKGLVLFIYLIETAQTLVMTNDCWKTFVKGFGDVSALNDVFNEWLAVPLFTAIVSFAVQIFYAHRLYVLSGRSRFSWPIVAFTCALSVLQLVGAIITSVQGVTIAHWSTLDSRFRVSEALWLAATALCDVVIAVGMVYCLLSKNEAVTRATQTIINKLIRLIVETGALTAIIALLSLVLFYSLPSKPVHAAAFDILAKSYSNSVMAIFNNRIKIVGGRESSDEESQLQISFHAETGSGPSIDTSQLTKRKVAVAPAHSDTYISGDTSDLERPFSHTEKQGQEFA